MKISSMSGLLEDSWGMVSVSAGNLLWYVLLAEVYEKNPASYRYGTEREWSILITFPGNCV